MPAQSTIASLLAARAREAPDRAAVREGDRVHSYAHFVGRVRRLAGALAARGIGAGDRLAVLSSNRVEYLEVFFAAAWCGAIVACQNTRLAVPELRHCLALVEPSLVLCSPERQAVAQSCGAYSTIGFGEGYEAMLASAEPAGEPARIDPESPLLILYTSGTTGLPKGAVISHRAEIARNLVCRAEYDLPAEAAFVAWAPMYHLGGAEYSIGTLISGGEVVVQEGFSAEAIADVVGQRALGWLILMPGMVGRLADVLEARATQPVGVRVCGVMPDLVPTADLVRITRLLDAPYANTFGATETGNPPASAGLLPIGRPPETLDKTPSVHCELRFVDAHGRDVPDGTPGELWMRGPTLFSGYWNDEEATAAAFEGDWFHMGDVFVRRPGGRIAFVDRVKYLIKSGGENIYPAEIERVLLADGRVEEAAVVRRPDERWGEVPVAFVARRDPALSAEALYAACNEHLARYKQPKAIVFIDVADFPRSASGKIVRHELEQRLAAMGS